MQYHNITKEDMLNGEGLRTVLWVAGCGHACPGCQNPVTWAEDGGLSFDAAAQDELFAALEHDYITGLTLSGGDPLYPANQKSIEALCKAYKARFPQKTIWLYTGYRWEEIRQMPLMQYIDVVVDGRYVEALRDTQLLWRGSENQRVIDVPKTFSLGQIVLRPEPDYCI